MTDLYTFDENGVYPNLDVKGQMPTSGSIALDKNCNIVASVSNNDFTIVKKIDDEYTNSDENNSVDYMFVPTDPQINKAVVYFTRDENAIIPDEVLDEYLNREHIESVIDSIDAEIQKIVLEY